MPLNQSPVTFFALNAANDTSPSGVADSVTGQPIFIPDLNQGVYFDLTNEEAASLSDTLIGTLYAGRYRRVRVDSGATAANVKTGTIGLMASMAAQSQDGQSISTPSENIVTSYDQGIGLATTVRPVVFLNSITPGNWGFVQELGLATVLGKAASFTGTPAIGAIVGSYTAGLVDVPSSTTAVVTTSLGIAVDLPIAATKFRILLQYVPVVQD